MVRRKTKDTRARTEGAQSVGRAVEILRAVARCQRSGATLSNIISVTELSRSTAFRLLRYLTEERLLEFDDRQRSYYLGPLAYELGLAARGQADLVAKWKDRIERLAAKTGLTAYLVARSDTEIVCLATAHGPSVVRAVTLVAGQRLPLGIGAGSLAILSSLPDDEVDSVIASHGPKLRMYGGGRLTPKILRQRVETTRTKGYALSQDSVAKGVLGIGVAIPRDGELTQLAVSLSLVATHLDAAEQTHIAKTIRKAIQS
jgi:DNA-binding IclR family transcriptional regulator